MRRKIILVILTIFMIILIFFCIDFQRAKNGQSPIFCIKYNVWKDGGTQEYLGLGYKVIEYHKLNGYKKIHIGTIFLKYDNELGAENGIKPINEIDDNIINDINSIFNSN